MERFIDLHEWAGRLAEAGPWAIVISLAVSIAISLLGVVPSLFWSGINALVFGMIGGFWISLAGEAIGAAIAYRLYGYGIRRTKLPAKFEPLLSVLRGRSRRNAAFWLLFARMTPFLPSGAVTLLAVLAAMNFTDYVIVTTLGKMPSVALETLIGHDLYNLKDQYERLLYVLTGLAAAYVVYRAVRARQEGKRRADEPPARE